MKDPLKASVRASFKLITAATMLVAAFISPVVAGATVVPDPSVTVIPYDAGSRHHPFASTSLNLAAMGYVEQEYEISGTANGYSREGTWGYDGKWNKTLSKPDVPYTTRILVRRPIDPDKFNGTVIVEWLNVSGQIDVDAAWAQAHTELLRDGYAWVGVSAQQVGVHADKSWDPVRYADLTIPSDSLSFDIFSQAAQAVRSQPQMMMGGFPIKSVIAIGESQSAGRLFTYVNAFNQMASQIFDGVLIYSRGASGSPIGGGMIPLGAPAVVRADSTLKVMQLETEQDLMTLGFAPARQPDTDYVHTWETAGVSHFDAYGIKFLVTKYQRDLPKLANAAVPWGCKHPLNNLPFQYIVNAAVVSMTNWVQTGEAPPTSPQIKLDAKGKVVRDANGNAEGGIRLPQMEAATALNSFTNPPGHGNVLLNFFLCSVLGNSEPFSAAKISRLYPTHRAYVRKFEAAANALLDGGFILQPDYDEAMAYARVANIPR